MNTFHLFIIVCKLFELQSVARCFSRTLTSMPCAEKVINGILKTKVHAFSSMVVQSLSHV